MAEVVHGSPHTSRRGTRHSTTVAEGVLEPGQPRLGRRESEPHSAEINYLYDVLSTNFPNDRTIWDLHHYFNIEGEQIDLQFDISYFRDLSIPYDLPSFKASRFGNRVPTMAVNFLSKSTYSQDIGITAEQCLQLAIPIYVVFNAHIPKPSAVRTPFLKVYYIENEGKTYKTIKITEACTSEDSGDIDTSNLIDIRPDLLPFKLGIQKLKRIYDERFPRYRLVLVDRETGELLKCRAEQAEQWAEQERKRAEQERRRAEQERRRAEQAEQQVEQERQRAEQAEQQVEQERQRAEQAEQKAKELEEKLRQLEHS